MKNIKLKILLSIAYLLIASLAFGQKDTTYINLNDSLVCVNKDVAIFITKELVRKDYLESKVVLLQKDTAALSQIVNLHSKNLDLANKKELAYKSIVANYQLTIKNYDDYVAKENKKLKWSKTKTTISQLALLALAILTIIKL